MKTNAEVWVKVETGGNDNNDFYELTILEIEAMKQEITSDDILRHLMLTGTLHSTSTLKQESLTLNPNLKKLLTK
ncbi:MAG: hypothetical protein JST20_03400 [Bacteroidetes bacterium]|nr:hypothetical protein [Bacteroidota bacterium]